MHAAIARRAVRLAVHHAAARLPHLELVAGEGILGDDEQRQTARTRLRVRIGAGQQRQHIGAPGERAPGLGAVDDVALLASDLRRVGGGVERDHGTIAVAQRHRHDRLRGPEEGGSVEHRHPVPAA